MLFPDMGVWGLRSNNLQPVLAVNPWAERPLPDVFWSFGRFLDEENKWAFKDGRNIGDILELPNPWPPAEEAGS